MLPKEVAKEIHRIKLRYDEDITWKEISDDISTIFGVHVTPKRCKKVFEHIEAYLDQKNDKKEVEVKDLEIPEVQFDTTNPRVIEIMKKVQFLDIETSLVDAKVFRTGLQNINANQLSSTTRILTVAGGSMYDLYTKGESGVWGYGNHHTRDTFKKDPLDDTEVLRKVWYILDRAEVIVAHNARFDKAWLLGRFLELGWKLPSRFSVVCTYRNLHDYNMTSKKLDELSHNLVGTNKLPTDFTLWVRCSEGDKKAFEEMMTYNKGDIYDTLFKVYMRTCQYAPQKCIDMTDYTTSVPQCRVTGYELEELDICHQNHTTGLTYLLYRNPSNGLQYVDRYNTNSKKSGKGFVKHYK
jgi:hypothetical protein